MNVNRVQPEASHFVDGAWREDAGGEAIDVVYPATGETIATVYEATPDVIEAALASAERAQADWAALKPVERGRVLHRAAALIRERGEDLARLETLDTGKPLSETRVAMGMCALANLSAFFAGDPLPNRVSAQLG